MTLRARQWVARNIGYRGTALSFLAVVWFAVGARLPVRPDPHPHLDLLLEQTPIWLRVAVWWGAAAVALFAAWWPRGKTKWGFVALVVPAAVRSLSSFGGAVFGEPSLWVDGLVWLGIVGFVMLVSDWPEPPRLEVEGDDS